MYSFLRRPIWILSHVLIALLIAVLITLGFWQRSRYYEESHEKQRLEAAAAATPVPLDGLLGQSDATDAIAYERVVVQGVYDVENEVMISNRSFNGAPGAWILTPLVQGDGTAVGVIRGWVPLSLAEGTVPVKEVAPPSEDVEVTGIVQLTQERESFGPKDPPTGKLDRLSRVDLARLGEQLDYPLAPVWVLLDGQNPPPAGELPRVVALQHTDPSQNFSYMMQWWIFAAIAIIGYPLVIRMVAKNRSTGGSKLRQRYSSDTEEIPWAEGLGGDGSRSDTTGSDSVDSDSASSDSASSDSA